MKMRMPWFIIFLALMASIFGAEKAFAWNPILDIQQNLIWTLGEEAQLGTAYKIGGSGPVAIGQRGDSAMLGIFDYRFLKFSYGAISNPQDGSKIGDGLKTGLMLNYFLGWFKSPQTPAMQMLNNINIGPTVSIPLLTDPHPLKYPSVWIEANYEFSGMPSTGK